MAEVPHSPGIRLALILAQGETDMLHQEFVTPDLMICGITKLQDIQSIEHLKQIGFSPDMLYRIGISPSMLPAYFAEAQQLLAVLEAAQANPRHMRRTLRERIGDGGHQRDRQGYISRSDEVRTAFERASDIAAENSARIVMAHHLFAALLDIPGTHTEVYLEEMGVDIKALHDALATLPTPEPLTDGGGTGGSGGIGETIADLGIDLTAEAAAGNLSPVIGRRSEMLRIIKTLGRDKKNCPVLVGAAGVGKTAIVEGLAQRIAVKNIHPDFHDKRIIQINASSLVSGTSYRGQFEERIEKIILEAASDPNLILFVDEIHLLVGAGASGSGGMDAANILKPALASGKIKMIGATTASEYRQFIEQDQALERRFEPVRVAEPSKEETIEMLTGIRDRLQAKHSVVIRDDAIIAAVELSVRYITERFLPDKAYTLLDSACSEAKYGSMLSFRGDVVDDDQLLGNVVTENTVRKVLADMRDIAVEALEEDDMQRIAHMADTLKERIVGQDGAINAVVEIVQRHYAGLSAPNRPIGVFLFTGPTGVGKTELAKATAQFLFSDEKRLIRLDMSEYMEKHNVSRLIGAPPGYTGYEQGGQLTNKLRDMPYAVVLIDEVEKAHPDVLNIFLQVFDNGSITDGQGRAVDAQNAIFIMTSNLGYTGATPNPLPEQVEQAVRDHLRPEFINRIDSIVYFKALEEHHMTRLVELQFEKLRQQLEAHFIEITVTPAALRWLAQEGYNPAMGARALTRLFESSITNPIAQKLLTREIAPGEIAMIHAVDNEIIIGKDESKTIYGDDPGV